MGAAGTAPFSAHDTQITDLPPFCTPYVTVCPLVIKTSNPYSPLRIITSTSPGEGGELLSLLKLSGAGSIYMTLVG